MKTTTLEAEPTTTTISSDILLNSRQLATVTWVDARGTRRSEIAGPGLLRHALVEAVPIRKSKSHTNSTSYRGHAWFSQTDQQLWTESRFEWFALMWLDMFHDIDSVAVQPMRIDFGDGLHHVPDVFALHADSRQVLYDIKPAATTTPEAKEQFRKTREVCARVGWGYEVFNGLPPIVTRNVKFLWNFRGPDYKPSAAVARRIIELLDTPRTISSVVMESGLLLPVVNTGIFHMVWKRQLRADLSTRFGYSTLIERNSNVRDA
jgi:hypothetical protein